MAMFSEQLRQHTIECTKTHVIFSNGCWLSLDIQDGLYWGTTPYGTDWACNADNQAPDRILQWVEHWNQPRDEMGNLQNGNPLEE